MTIYIHIHVFIYWCICFYSHIFINVTVIPHQYKEDTVEAGIGKCTSFAVRRWIHVQELGNACLFFVGEGVWATTEEACDIYGTAIATNSCCGCGTKSWRRHPVLIPVCMNKWCQRVTPNNCSLMWVETKHNGKNRSTNYGKYKWNWHAWTS